MRRRSAEPLPSWTEVEAGLGAAQVRGVVRASFPLRTITPVVGGGSAKLEPDPAEPVRLPEVRGALRWWWRALFQGDQGAEALFLEEARLWGAVDVPVGNGREAAPSRVRLDVEVRQAGSLSRAGMHEIGRNGMPKAAASWGEHHQLRYALFPLQASEEERADHVRQGRQGALATRQVRTGLFFDLAVTITETGPDRLQQVLLAIWAWIRFGGLGARTRRGFGALELAGPVEWVSGKIEPPLAFATGGIEAEWRALQSLAAASSRLGPAARLLVGPEEPRASGAHGTAVELLQTFRQGVGCGRRQGDGRPGHSNWPEADHMRRLAGVAPRDPISAEDAAAAWGAPRAAFGLPLQIKFKHTDREDQPANATIVPTKGGRWSSPLILRPIPVGSGGYRPLALLLGGAGPTDVEVQERGETVPVRSAAGAKPPIRPLLERTGGDALQAFGQWLESRHRFVDVSSPGRPVR